MKVCISKIQLKNLLEVLEVAQKKDSSVSNCVEIELIAEGAAQLETDHVRFSARSVYAECNNTFLGTN